MDGVQFGQFHRALQSAFPTLTSLRMLARTGLNERLESIASEHTLADSAYELIEWAEAQGRLEELIAHARQANPGNQELQRFAEQFVKVKELSPNREPVFPLLSQTSLPQPSSFFTGREEILKVLTAALTTHSTVALSGIGGMGKTQVALRYAADHSQDYAHVFFVNADSMETLQASYADISRQLNLLPQEVSDLTLIAATVHKWLCQTPGWLLLADNADDLNTVRDMLPFRAKGRLLLTTREAIIGGLGHLIPLQSLSETEGAALLLSRAHYLQPTQTLDDIDGTIKEDAMRLSQQLGGLPLALEQAGSYLEVMRLSPREYLALYKENAAELLAQPSYNSLDAHAPVGITFKLAFEKIEQRSPATADLLRICSLLAPDPIPEEIFIQGAEQLGEILRPFLPQRLHELIREAGRFSLISREPHNRNLLIHNVVQQVIRDGVDEAVFRLWMERIIRALNTNLPDPEFALWPLYERLLPHAMICAVYIEQESLETEEAAYLLHQIGWYLSDRVQYVQAEPLKKKALEIRERILGAEHHDTAKSLANLARLYRDTGRFAQAEPLFERTLTICEKVLGPEHPDTATALSHLASLYSNMGRHTQAEPLYERSLAIRERVLGPEHPDTAATLGNLANLYRDTNRNTEAGPMMKRALAIYRRVWGLKDPRTKSMCQQYVMCLRKQGRLKEAWDAEKRC